MSHVARDSLGGPGDAVGGGGVAGCGLGSGAGAGGAGLPRPAPAHRPALITLAFTILGEPASKANSRKLVTFGRGEKARPAIVKSDKAQAYERTATLQIPAWAKRMLTGELRLTIVIFYASERPDLDESVVLDVLQARYARDKKTGERQLVRRGVYVNDRQVREKHIYHAIDRDIPRAEIVVEALEPQQAALAVEPPRKVANGDPF